MIAEILQKTIDGIRLNDADALKLLQSSDLASLGAAAERVSRSKHPEGYRTYNIDRNINYTNIQIIIIPVVSKLKYNLMKKMMVFHNFNQ